MIELDGNYGYSENIAGLDRETPVFFKPVNEVLSKIFSNTVALNDAINEKRSVSCGVFFGSGDESLTEVNIQSLPRSDITTFTVPPGRYMIACEQRIKKIRDRNMLDVTEDFEETNAEGYYVYVFKHVTTIPMEFTVYF